MSMAEATRPARRLSQPTGWPAHGAALAGTIAALLLLFAGDAADIADQWWNSSTYEHCLAIPPILAWLVWIRLPALRATPPETWTPGLIAIAAGALGWLVGEAAAAAVIRQFALLLMLEGAIAALLGPAALRILVFPLGFALFLVPAGDFLIPPLQTVTAGLSMALLHVSGVPARLEGVFITTPDGWFEVAAACSGVKFLIAMVALGVLAANLCFTGWIRRVVFLAACVVLPILANGVRAWGTIYIAHLFGARYATGFDHIVYGWFFFAAVIALMLAIAWPFFEDPGLPEAVAARGAAPRRPLALIAGAALGIALLPIAWSHAIAAGTPPLPAASLPRVPGWRPVPVSGVPWRARFAGADRVLAGRYADGRGRSADLVLAVFRSQDAGRRLTGFGQGAIDPDGAWAWARGLPDPPRGKAELISGPGQASRAVLSFYRVGRITTGGEVAVKLETLRIRLAGGPRRAVALLVSADAAQGGRPAADALLAALGDIDGLMDRAAGPR